MSSSLRKLSRESLVYYKAILNSPNQLSEKIIKKCGELLDAL